MRLYLVIGNNVDLKKFPFDGDIIAIDKGAKRLMEAGISFQYAVGDFDSIGDKKLLKKLSEDAKCLKLNPIKDDTDTYHALSLFYDKYQEIYIVGGISGARQEHFIANLKLFYHFPKIKLIDDNSVISLVENGATFTRDQYTYYSFFALENVTSLTLRGFKYAIQNFDLKIESALCISNELKDEVGYVSFKSGSLLLIKSREDNK